MAQFQVEVTLKNNGLVLIQGSTFKYWKGTGLPDYEGGADGLEKMFPEVVKELIELKVVKEI